MEVIELTDKSQSGYLAPRVLAWYIAMKNHKILFATGEPGNFWRCTETMKLPMDEIDMLFLSQGYQDSIRELECFLRYNNKAKIYVSRENNEICLRSIYYKLFSYTGQVHSPAWKKRIIFMDKSIRIGDDVQIFTEERFENYQCQNLIIGEDEMKVLFVNGRRNTVELVQALAASISGHHMNYLFYSGKQGDGIRKNCITGESEKVVDGQTIVCMNSK